MSGIPRVDVARMSDAELLDKQRLLTDAVQKRQRDLSEIRNSLARIKTELALRRDGRRKRGEPGISDHAVVRYLERHRSVDIEAIRNEIRDIALRSKFDRDQKASGELLVDEQTGVRMIYSGERNAIATVLLNDDNARARSGDEAG